MPGPGEEGLGGWAPGSASGQRAGPRKGREAQEEVPFTSQPGLRVLGSSHLIGCCPWGPPKRLEAQLSVVLPTFCGEKNPFSKSNVRRGRWLGCPEGHPRELTLQPLRRQELGSPCHPPALWACPLSPLVMLTMGVLGSPSNCRDGQRKGSVELLVALALGKVQFLASWTGGGGPGSSQGSARGQGEGGWWQAELQDDTPFHADTYRQDRADGPGGQEWR